MGHQATPDELLDCAVEAVHAAGKHAAENPDRRTEIVQRTKHDVKLQLDIECQEKAESAIIARYPGHSILGEEDESRPEKPPVVSDYEWIIDPIDGTVNFSHGMRRWCCSVAVSRSGQMLAGAVYAPELGELYTATAESPSACNGRPIRVSTTADISEALVLSGLDKNVDPKLPPFAIFRHIASNVQKTRVMGCAALDICSVACGWGDAYFESGIYTWDIAAAGLIVEQAGGRTERLGSNGGHRLRFMAGNGLINDRLKEIVAGTPA